MSSVVSDPKTLEEYDGQPDTEYDDLIHDISDPEEEFEEDDGDVWEKTWKSFEKACVDEGTNSLAVFGTHIYGINSHLGSDLTALTSRLSIKEILELTNKIKVKTPEPPKPSFVVIRLQKGLNIDQINGFIVKIDSQLEEGKFKDVNVVTEDWATSGEPFPMINAAKKLFTKYVESGLLGCLVSRGYHDAAKKLYCVAYVKGKVQEGNIIFSGIDPADYQNKAASSLKIFNTLVPST